MTKRIIYSALLCGCVLMTGCGKKAPQAGAQQSSYEVITIGLSDKELKTNYSASIRGRQDIDIYPQVSGTISKVSINEGEEVREGQTLFIIDQVPYEAALKVAEANVKTAEAAVATAQLVYDSKQALFKESVISEFDLATAKNSLLTAQAQQAQAEAQLVNAKNNLSYTVVKSPCNGVAGKIPFRAGALVSPSLAKPLTTISDNSNMYVYFSMTENQLLNLIRKYGSKDSALVQMPSIQLQLNDKSMYAEQGRVESISGVIDPSTGTVSVRAVFPNPNGLLASGASGTVIMPEKRDRCIAIPQATTFEIQDKTFVYRVVDGKAASTPVVVSRVNGQEYVVESGLSVGDVIVGEGVSLLREGTPINVKQN